MNVFKLLNQYETVCRSGFLGCAAKLNKSIQTNIIEILLLIMCIPRKINFLQLGRYGRRTEQCYRQTFARGFDWLQFNMNLAANRFQHGGRRLAIAIDPSYVSKAGKKTAHVGRFWSGCASAVKHGLEILGVGLIDADIRDCVMLRAVQTRSPKELKARDMTLPQWYIHVLEKLAAKLLRITDVVVADAAFSNLGFVDGLEALGFRLVSRLRSDAVLFYPYLGSRSGKRGRPKQYDGKIDFANPDKSRMERIPGDPSKGEAYHLAAWSKALKRKVRLVVIYSAEGSHTLLFCTDPDMPGVDVLDFYRTRFQIEFCYRDGHQFAGLLDCQGRSEEALDFAFNASLAAVNAVKVLRKETGTDMSIGRIKSLMVNSYFLRRFFDVSGLDPNITLNTKNVKELIGIATDAA